MGFTLKFVTNDALASAGGAAGAAAAGGAAGAAAAGGAAGAAAAGGAAGAAAAQPAPPAALLRDAKALVDEVARLAQIWEQSLDQTVIKTMIANLAADHGFNLVGDPTQRSNYTPPKPYLTEVRTKATFSAVFTFVPETGGNLSLILEPDRFGAPALVCPSCGESTVGKRPAVAHSIIPQTIWKSAIEASVTEWLAMIGSGALTNPDRPGVSRVRSFSRESGQESGTPVGARFHFNDADAAAGGGAAAAAAASARDETQNPDMKLNRAFLDLLSARSLVMSSYAAQDNSERQCLKCEAVQADASLMQRHKLFTEGALPAEATYNKQTYALDARKFVGLRYLRDADAISAADREAKLSPVSVEEAFKRKTLAQIGRFLLGIEKTIQVAWKKKNGAPILLLLVDHWEEFVWVFRTRMLRECGADYRSKIS